MLVNESEHKSMQKDNLLT